MAWSFHLANLKNERIGEVRNATGRQLTLGINRAATAQFTVRYDNPLLLELFREEDRKLQVYDGTTLRYSGYVTSTELSDSGGEAPTIQVNSADAAWKLAHRISGKSNSGTSYTGDKAKTARKIINELNGEADSGVKVEGEGSYEAGGSGTYVAGPYKATLACINDLAHGLDGFDWKMEPYIGEESKAGIFVAKTVLGTASGMVFERGYGQKNVKSISYVRDMNTLANRAYHLPEEGLEHVFSEVRTKNDAASEAAHGRFEAIAEAPGLIDTTLRDKWLEEFIRVRKNPRYVVGMTLDRDDGTGRVPKFGTDFNLGDTATARAVMNNVTLFNGTVRIYQVRIEVDEAGAAIVTPVLLDEEGEELAT